MVENTLHYTLILSHSPSDTESNLTAQAFAREVLDSGDKIDRVFFYQDACYIALASQVPGQGLQSSYQGWLDLAQDYSIPLQVCIANGLRRGVLDEAEAKRYEKATTLHSGFNLVGLGEMAEACQQSDRIVKL